jgi:hypothetical protein
MVYGSIRRPGMGDVPDSLKKYDVPLGHSSSLTASQSVAKERKDARDAWEFISGEADLWDAGPPDEGWQSPQMVWAINALDLFFNREAGNE